MTRIFSPVGVRSWSPGSRSAASYHPGRSPSDPCTAGRTRPPCSSTQNECSTVATSVSTVSLLIIYVNAHHRCQADELIFIHYLIFGKIGSELAASRGISGSIDTAVPDSIFTLGRSEL